MKELSPVQRCRRNNWGIGTILRGVEWEMGNPQYEYWKITGFGEYEVLGKQVNLRAYTTSSETTIPFSNLISWRRIKD